MSLSVMTTHRVAAVHGLESFFRSYADPLGSRLSRDLEPLLEPGETMPDVELTLRLLGRLLSQKRRALDSADHQRADAEAALDSHRRRRDATAKRLRRQFVGMRETVKAFYGDAGLKTIGLNRKVARQPFELWDSCRHVLHRAAEADLGRLETAFTRGGPTAEQITANLAGATAELKGALRAVDAGIRDADAARAEKKRLSEDLEASYVGLGELARALCRVCGEPELARRTHRPLRDLDRKRRAGEPAVSANVRKARADDTNPRQGFHGPRVLEASAWEEENEPRVAELPAPEEVREARAGEKTARRDVKEPRGSEPAPSIAALRARRRELTPPERLILASRRLSTPSKTARVARCRRWRCPAPRARRLYFRFGIRSEENRLAGRTRKE